MPFWTKVRRVSEKFAINNLSKARAAMVRTRRTNDPPTNDRINSRYFRTSSARFSPHSASETRLSRTLSQRGSRRSNPFRNGSSAANSSYFGRRFPLYRTNALAAVVVYYPYSCPCDGYYSLSSLDLHDRGGFGSLLLSDKTTRNSFKWWVATVI